MATTSKRKRSISPPCTGSEGSDIEYEVENILHHRTVNNHQEFYVKWKGWPDSDCTWEPMEGLKDCRQRILEYFQRIRQTKSDFSNKRSVASKVTNATTKTVLSQTTRQNARRGLSQTNKDIKNSIPLHTPNPLTPSLSLSPTVRLQRATLKNSIIPSSSVVKRLDAIDRKQCRTERKTSSKKDVHSYQFRKLMVPCTNVFPSPSPTPSVSSNEYDSDDPEIVFDSSCSPTKVSSNTNLSSTQQVAQVTTVADQTDDYDENDPRVVTVLTKLPKKREVYKIHGVVRVTGNLTLLVEWDNDERDLNLVDSKIMNSTYPQKVIEFYQKNLQFKRMDNEEMVEIQEAYYLSKNPRRRCHFYLPNQ